MRLKIGGFEFEMNSGDFVMLTIVVLGFGTPLGLACLYCLKPS